MCVCASFCWPLAKNFFFWLSVPFRLLSLDVPLVFTVPHNVDPRVVFTSIGSTPKPRILLACHATLFFELFSVDYFLFFPRLQKRKNGCKIFWAWMCLVGWRFLSRRHSPDAAEELKASYSSLCARHFSFSILYWAWFVCFLFESIAKKERKENEGLSLFGAWQIFWNDAKYRSRKGRDEFARLCYGSWYSCWGKKKKKKHFRPLLTHTHTGV